MCKIKLASLAAITILFAGCASAPKPAAYDEAHSKAWNIATAAGLDNVKDYVVTDHTDLNAAALGGAYIGASQIPGVSFSATDIGVGIVSSILSSGVKPAVGTDQIFAWLPSEQTDTPEFARLKVATIVGKAMNKAATHFWTGKLITTQYPPTWGGDTMIVHVNSKGNDKVYAFSSIRTPVAAYSPSWMGGGKAWQFGIMGNSGSHIGIIGVEDKVTHYKFILAVSHALPRGFYVYLAPTTTHGPLIINQGKILTFAKPKAVASN